MTIVELSAGSKDHVKVQGEILEGLVARVVSHESSKHMEDVLEEFPPPPLEGGTLLCFVFQFLSNTFSFLLLLPYYE